MWFMKMKDLRIYVSDCNLNRYEEITPFVKLLEKTEEVRVKIEGNTITFHKLPKNDYYEQERTQESS